MSSGHGSHDIKTITIDAGKGIKALYCVDCKEVITYLFDVDKWTMEEAKDWVASHKLISLNVGLDDTGEFIHQVTVKKGAIPFHSYPMADEGASWDGPGEVAKADVSDLKKMCTWYDSSNPDLKSSYKLPHHKADGYTTVWSGVRAAMSRLYQGRTQIPDSDRKACHGHLAKHYKEFGKDAPEWGKEYSDDELLVMLGEDNMGKNLDRRTKDIIGATVRYKSHGQFAQKAEGDSDSGEMLVRGFFTSDGKDEVGDIITKEATVRAIEKWRRWGNIRTMHDYPSGRVAKIGEADGLAWNEIVTVPVDEATKKLIAGGVLKAYSVGIIPRRYDINEDAIDSDNVDPFFLPLVIHEYDMVEISYVDHPANYSATISDVSSGKSAEFGDRVVLFKRLEDLGDIANMDNNIEKDENEAEDVGVNEADDSAEEFEDAGAEDASDDEPGDGPGDEEPGASDDATDDNAVDDGEPEPNLLKAVQEVGGRLDVLEGHVLEVASKLDGFVESVIGGVVEALSQSDKSVDSDNDEADSDSRADEEDLVARISEKVLSGLAEILTPQASRSSMISVDSSEDSDGAPVDKVRQYMEMSPAERRSAMKQVLRDITNK